VANAILPEERADLQTPGWWLNIEILQSIWLLIQSFNMALEDNYCYSHGWLRILVILTIFYWDFIFPRAGFQAKKYQSEGVCASIWASFLIGGSENPLIRLLCLDGSYL
jgi:hypothetical protein